MRYFFQLTVALVLASLALAARAEVTQAEMSEVAIKIEKSIAGGDDSVFIALFANGRFLDRVTRNIPTTPEYKQSFINELANGKFAKQFASQIVASLKDGGSYHYLRSSNLGGENGMLFRLYGEGGLNYHNIILEKDPTGAVWIVDAYIALSGEKLSELLRRVYLQGAMAVDKGGANAVLPPHFTAVMDMQKAIQGQQYQRVLDLYDALPEKGKQEKFIVIFRILAAQHLDDQTYVKVLNESRQLLKDDVTADLISVDALLLSGKYDEAIQSLQRLQKGIGADAVLVQMEANTLLKQGHPEAAMTLALAGVKLEPDSFNVHDSALSIALSAQRYEIVLQELQLLETKFGMKFDRNFKNSELYDGFRKSAEYQQWVKTKKDADKQ